MDCLLRDVNNVSPRLEQTLQSAWEWYSIAEIKIICCDIIWAEEAEAMQQHTLRKSTPSIASLC